MFSGTSEEPVLPFEQRNCRQMCCFHIWLLGNTAAFGHPLVLHLWGKGISSFTVLVLLSLWGRMIGSHSQRCQAGSGGGAEISLDVGEWAERSKDGAWKASLCPRSAPHTADCS